MYYVCLYVYVYVSMYVLCMYLLMYANMYMHVCTCGCKLEVVNLKTDVTPNSRIFQTKTAVVVIM